jgi:Tfp pilus assembly protein PilO
MKGLTIPTKNIYAIILTLICLALAFYAYSSLWPNYSGAQAAVNRAESDKVRLGDALDSIEDFVDTYNAEASNVSEANLFLPSKNPDLANFLSNIEQLSVQSGVALEGLSVTESTIPASENAIQTIDVGFSASGSYLSLKSFILSLQRNIRLVDIYQLNLSAPQQSAAGGTTILQYQIKLKTYFQQ